MKPILTCRATASAFSLLAASILVAGCSAAPRTQPDWRSAAAAADACVPRAATRIPNGAGGCPGAPGRAYSQEDIQRTGQPNVADALQMLDPSITVHH